MLKPSVTTEEYLKGYADILKRISIADLKESFDRVSSMHGGVDIALLCYEKPGDFCHRHLFADWWKEQTGEVIPEFGVEDLCDEIEKENVGQLSLF